MSRRKIDPESVNFADREQLLAYVRQLPKTQRDLLWMVANRLQHNGPEAMPYLYGAVDQIGDETMLKKEGFRAAVAKVRALALAKAIGREASPRGGRIE